MTRPDRGDETLDELYSSAWSRHGDGPEPSAADFLADHPDASPSERSTSSWRINGSAGEATGPGRCKTTWPRIPRWPTTSKGS